MKIVPIFVKVRRVASIKLVPILICHGFILIFPESWKNITLIAYPLFSIKGILVLPYVFAPNTFRIIENIALERSRSR